MGKEVNSNSRREGITGKTEWELWTDWNDIPKVEKSLVGKDEKETPAGHGVSVDGKRTEAGGHPGSGFRLSAIADYGSSTALG